MKEKPLLVTQGAFRCLKNSYKAIFWFKFWGEKTYLVAYKITPVLLKWSCSMHCSWLPLLASCDKAHALERPQGQLTRIPGLRGPDPFLSQGWPGNLKWTNNNWVVNRVKLTRFLSHYAYWLLMGPGTLGPGFRVNNSDPRCKNWDVLTLWFVVTYRYRT